MSSLAQELDDYLRSVDPARAVHVEAAIRGLLAMGKASPADAPVHRKPVGSRGGERDARQRAATLGSRLAERPAILGKGWHGVLASRAVSPHPSFESRF